MRQEQLLPEEERVLQLEVDSMFLFQKPLQTEKSNFSQDCWNAFSRWVWANHLKWMLSLPMPSLKSTLPNIRGVQQLGGTKDGKLGRHGEVGKPWVE